MSDSDLKTGLKNLPINEKGRFCRKDSQFRNFITADGSSGFPAARDRYHLYISWACPWACRVMMVRALKGLEEVLPYTNVDWYLDDGGWKFTDTKPNCQLDAVNGCKTLKEVYKIADEGYTGRVTVPVLWDKHKRTIVNNESSEILRMLNSEFNQFCPSNQQSSLDLYPVQLRTDIDAINSIVYDGINNGVYKCGFATKQEAYNEAVTSLFESLNKVEDILSKRRYLVGKSFTEADIRLFVTLIRFDAVYHGHFKCNKKKIIEYPNIWNYCLEIYQMKGISETVNMEHIMKHYMASHLSINPYGIISIGPDLNLNQSHNRNPFD